MPKGNPGKSRKIIKGHERQGYATLKNLYNNTKGNARKRNIEFNLDFEFFCSVVVKNCFWCNADALLRNAYLKVNTKTFNKYYQKISQAALDRAYIKVLGLDRIDNNCGYIEANVVSCCHPCNRAKSNLSLSEWLAYLEDLVNFRKSLK